MKFSVAPLLLGFFLLACGPPKDIIPDDLLDAQTFAAIMVDAQIAEGIKTQYIHSKGQGRNLGAELYAHLLEKHEVSEGDFLKTYQYYQTRPDLMESIYEQVLDSLSKLEAQIKQEYTTNSNTRIDTVESLNAGRKAYQAIKPLVDSLSVQPSKSL